MFYLLGFYRELSCAFGTRGLPLPVFLHQVYMVQGTVIEFCIVEEGRVAAIVGRIYNKQRSNPLNVKFIQFLFVTEKSQDTGSGRDPPF